MLRKTMLAALVAGASAVIVTGPGVFASGGTPANKVVAAGSHTEEIAPGTNVTLLTATMKTSKPTDLMIQTTLECSILTELTTNSEQLTAVSEGKVRAWIEFDDKIVPIQSASEPPQDPADQPEGGEADKVTFCNREYKRTVADDEGDGGVDEEHDYIRTKSAHGFNWVRMNTGSGLHKIELVADLTATSTNGASEAIVGNRTLIVEPTKMANNAIISDTGTSASGSTRSTAKSRALRKKLRRR